MGLEENDDFIIGEERHREILRAFRTLTEKIPQQKIDPAILDSIKNSIDALAQEVKMKAPAQTGGFDQAAFDKSLQVFSSKIIESLDELKAVVVMYNAPREYEHTIERNQFTDRPTKVISKEIKRFN